MSLDDFFVEAVNRFVVPVSFRSLTGQHRRVHEFSSAELASRQDYPSGVTIAWAVVNPADGSVIPPSTTSPLPPRMSHRTPRVISPVTTSSSTSHSSPLEAVVSDVQLRVDPVLNPVLATEVIRVNSWRMRDVVELLVAKLGEVEAKERSGAVELRNVKERLVISEAKVTTSLEVTERSRDRVTSRPAARRQKAAQLSDRAEHDEDPYRDYDRDDDPYRGASSR